jgi:hypothetical protein
MIYAIHTWTKVPDGGDPTNRRMYFYDNMTNIFTTHDWKLVSNNLLPKPDDLNINFEKTFTPIPPQIGENEFQPPCQWCVMVQSCKHSYYRLGKYPDMDTCEDAFFKENKIKFIESIEKTLEKDGLTPFMITACKQNDIMKIPEARMDFLDLKNNPMNNAWTPPPDEIVAIMPEVAEEYYKPRSKGLVIYPQQ